MVVLLAAGLFIWTQPMRTTRELKREKAAAAAAVQETEADIVRMDDEIEEARSDAAIRRRARELTMSAPGEELVIMLDEPIEPLGLPDAWPFVGIERAFGAG